LPGEQLPPYPPNPVLTVTEEEGVTDTPVARTIPPPPPPPPDGVEPFDIPPPPPPATTKTSTELMDAGTVHVRVANSEDPVGVVDAVAKVSTQSPFAATLMDTPVASFTSAVQIPLVTVAALAGEAINATGIATTEKAKRQLAPISDNNARETGSRLLMPKSYSEEPGTVVNRE
jgi:hypothetical protein